MDAVKDKSITKREVDQVETKRSLSSTSTKEFNKGAWTAEEDRKLVEFIAIHGPRRWKTVAVKAGLNRGGKSCRLRWMNYLRPNIKRGNISDQEEDLILRLHKLLGNRWSLIAGRLPGRTDNEIKNYWNSHLSKKINQKERQTVAATRQQAKTGEERRREVEKNNTEPLREEENSSASDNGGQESNNIGFNVDEFFDFSNEDPLNLDGISRFLEPDESFLSDINNSMKM